MIVVKNLRKTYRTYKRRDGVWGSIKDLLHREYQMLPAVDGISFSVQEGELLGYIGPNGAGKSTSIKMLTGILRPTSGEISVYNFHPFNDRKKYTQHIGVVFGQRTQLWWDIAVKESMRLLAKIYQVSDADYKRRLDQLSAILGLEELLSTPVRKLSLGQRMRCDLAASLIHNPKVLFLDEPTIGLDTVAKDSIRSFLRQINREFGTTILLTTHDLNEIEELCKRIIVLDKGRVIYDGGLAELKNQPGLKRTVTVDFSGEVALDELKSRFGEGVEFISDSQRRMRILFDGNKVSSLEIVQAMLDTKMVSDLSIAQPTIEEVVMKIYREGV